jgi:phosphate transport system permease protein
MASEKSSNAKTGHKFQRSGFSYEQLIRFFFASNAGLSIVILTLIIAFLLKEGLGFFPGYRRDLETYRIAGLEFVDISRNNLTAHEQLTSLLNRAYYAEVNGKSSRELKRTEEASALYNAFTDQVGPTRDLILNNPQAETDGNAGMKAALLNNYEKQREKALQKPLSTPHLTNEERQQLIESLRARPPEATDDPPLVAALAQEFVAAQQKHAAPLQEFRTVIDDFESAGFDLGSIVMEMTESVTVTKEQLQTADILEKDRKTLLAAASGEKDPVERERLLADAHAALADKPDVETPMQALLERKPECVRLHEELKTASSAAFDKIPQSLTESDAKRILSAARKAWPVFITIWHPEKSTHGSIPIQCRFPMHSCRS